MALTADRKSIVRRAAILALIVAVEFVLIEAALRAFGAFETTSTFQSLFMEDPRVGIRLRPGSQIRYSTVEFTADIAINAQGVRDDRPIGPKPPDERRVLVLGDSLVLSVQVSRAETFCDLLERQLNEAGGPTRWRVINGGVQGYGPVEEWFFFDKIAADFQPDIVLIVAFAGNDATDAAGAAASFDAGAPIQVTKPGARWIRRVVRSSAVLQLVRIRWDQLRSRVAIGTPEPPLATYLTQPPAAVQTGLDVARRAYGRISERAKDIGARTGIVLMPARFQINDTDYRNYVAIVRDAGGELDRNAGSRRLREALAPLALPIVDLQPILFAQPDRPGLFYQRTVHLTPVGHRVVADALAGFLRQQGFIPATGQFR